MNNEQLIAYLNQDLLAIPGIGIKAKEAFLRLSCTKVIDLLFHFPTKIITRKILPPSDYQLQPDERVVNKVKVLSVPAFKYGSKVIKIPTVDQNSYPLNLVFFGRVSNFIYSKIKAGDEVFVLGKLEIDRQGNLQMMHPRIYDALDKLINLN